MRKRIRSLLLIVCTICFSLILFAEDEKMTCEEVSDLVFRASEQLRMNDPTIRIEGVESLFLVGGLSVYTTLQYLWIAESSPKVRMAILHGFKRIDDHIYLADPEFPKYWLDSLKQFTEPIQRERLNELKEVFPKQINEYLQGQTESET